jgi:tetratricopeptide (TPR) repeat protein
VSLPPENVRVAALAAAQGGGAGNSKTLVAALAGALVVALIAVGFFATRHTKGSSSSDDSAEVGPDAKAERKFALRTAEEAVAGHRYSEAIRNLDAARRAGATAAELRSYADIQAEARSEDLFHEMESAMGSQDVDRARKLLGVLTASPQTWYGNKAAEKAEAVTAGYVNLHLAAAGLMKGKDNAGCLAEAQLALAANPRSADAQSLVEGCKAAPQAAAPDRPAAVHTSARPAVEKPAAVVATARQQGGDPDSDAKRLVNDGNQKLVAQDFPGAIALYQQALSLKPGDLVLAGIYRSMGIAFTRQGNIEEGAHYYKLYLPLCTNPGERAQLQKVLDDYEARRR